MAMDRAEKLGLGVAVGGHALLLGAFALGLLASAIGAAGADIRGLTVLKSEDGRGFDEVTVAVPGTDPTDLLNVLNAIGGVEVISIEKV